MIIQGVALLAFCTLAGAYVGDLIGALIGVKANVGGVGVAMILLIAARYALMKQGRLSEGLKGGVSFWSMMYIPIVVAMAAQQNVVAAVRGGPMVLIAGTLVVAVSFALVRALGGRPASPEVGS
ncbi:MAG: malonate transporter subunit MadL [Alphaproteobacteria bacterium]|nr:malonate transporter subunit MadL [Alphaproteobacteria bacterium]